MKERDERKCDKYCTLLLLAIVALLFFVSCKSPSVLFDSDFKQKAQEFDVKGRNGLLIKQRLAFGPYSTGSIRRGWLRSYDLPFIIRFSGASEKLSFSINNGNDTVAVNCLGKVRRQELGLLSSYFGIVIREEDAFAGNVSLDDNTNWDFVLHNASNTNAFNEIQGFMRNPEGQIDIRAIRQLEGKNTFLSAFGVYGYELTEQGRVIAAVDIMNKGRVFLSPELSPQKRLLMSAMCAALLLRTNLETQAS